MTNYWQNIMFHCHYVHHKTHSLFGVPSWNSGCEKPATNRLRYGTVCSAILSTEAQWGTAET